MLSLLLQNIFQLGTNLPDGKTLVSVTNPLVRSLKQYQHFQQSNI